MNQLNLEGNLSATLDQIREIEALASEKIMTVYREGDFNVKQKSDNSPVTKADLAAHTTIVEGLSKISSGIPILSEEGTAIPYAERQRWPMYWLVDPVDGTRDFVAKTDNFSVNIALIRNHVPILGVIHLPVTDECFFAAENIGAFKSLGSGASSPIHTRKMEKQTAVVTVSGFRGDSVLSECLKKLTDYRIEYIGSSIKSCRVAEGKIDWYPCLGPTSEWDTAAAQCIVEQAGGTLTNLHKQALRYNTKDSLRNPWFMACGDPSHEWHSLVPEGSETSPP